MSLYASVYLRHYEEADRFFGLIGMFTTSMLGVVLADNMLPQFLFWELNSISISSFLLIGFNRYFSEFYSSLVVRSRQIVDIFNKQIRMLFTPCSQGIQRCTMA